jgi:flavodoxin I
MFFLYEQFEECGATLVGAWDTEGYDFQKSRAVVDDRFVGLALDQDNQKELTPVRLETWLKNLAEAWA